MTMFHYGCVPDNKEGEHRPYKTCDSLQVQQDIATVAITKYSISALRQQVEELLYTIAVSAASSMRQIYLTPILLTVTRATAGAFRNTIAIRKLTYKRERAHRKSSGLLPVSTARLVRPILATSHGAIYPFSSRQFTRVQLQRLSVHALISHYRMSAQDAVLARVRVPATVVIHVPASTVEKFVRDGADARYACGLTRRNC